jgi:hypothetical protein
MNLPTSGRRATASGVLACALLMAMTGAALAQPTTEQAVEVNNEPTEVLSPGLELLRAEDATLTRTDDGIVIELTMDVPTPGTYTYPDGVPPERQAAPEAFTMWIAIFNYPEECTGGEAPFLCGADDFTAVSKGGMYGGAGHVPSIDHSGGAFEYDRATEGRMKIVGAVDVGDPQLPDSPPDSINFPLENPRGAEVHVAIAPHGQIVPETLSSDLYDPLGGPSCGCWWGAFFLAGSD